MSVFITRCKSLFRKLRVVLLVVFLIVVGTSSYWAWMNADPVVVFPEPTYPQPNAVTYFEQAGKAIQYSSQDIRHYVRWPLEIPLATRKSEIARLKPVLGIIHEGMKYPYQLQQQTMEVKYGQVRLYPPEIQFLRYRNELSDFLGLVAQTEFDQQHWGASIDTSLDGLQYAAMTHNRREGKIRPLAWDTVEHLTADQASGAAQRMEKIDAQQQPYAEVLKETKDYNVRYWLAIFKDPTWRFNLDKLVKFINCAPPKEFYALRYVNERKTMASMLSYYDALIARAELPYADPSPVPTAPKDPLCKLYVDGEYDGRASLLAADVRNRLLMIALALQAYKQEHGQYPLTLAALAPTFVHAVPKDPFSLGKDFQYTVTGGKYLLYSIGPDCIDDGGKELAAVEEWGGESDIAHDDKGDIVAWSKKVCTKEHPGYL